MSKRHLSQRFEIGKDGDVVLCEWVHIRGGHVRRPLSSIAGTQRVASYGVRRSAPIERLLETKGTALDKLPSG